MQLLPYVNSLNQCILPAIPNEYQVKPIPLPSAFSYVVTYISLPKQQTMTEDILIPSMYIKHS